MKIAVIADIHSNIFALDAVLADIARHSVAHIVNLGDTLYGPIAPRQTWQRLAAHNIWHISGNQDRYIYASDAAARAANPTLQWICDELGATGIDWLRAHPPTLSLADGIFLCHGTPQNDSTYLLEDPERGQLRDDNAILAHLHGESAPLILCGHSHLPRCVQLSNGQLIVNPGSVGLPAYADEAPVLHRMENHSPHARYALIEKHPHGWHIQHCHIPYDDSLAAQAARARGREDWASALLTGKALT